MTQSELDALNKLYRTIAALRAENARLRSVLEISESRPIQVGDRVIWNGEAVGTVLIVHRDVACVLYDDGDTLDVSLLSDLEHEIEGNTYDRT